MVFLTLNFGVEVWWSGCEKEKNLHDVEVISLDVGLQPEIHWFYLSLIIQNNKKIQLQQKAETEGSLSTPIYLKDSITEVLYEKH